MALYSELKRRNVLKVAVLYVVAGWLILQVADTGASALGLPVWAGKFVMLLLAIGFPVALIFSWVYEITPEGVKKEIDVDQTQSIVYKTGQKLNAAVAVLLVLGIAGLVADRLLPDAGPFRTDLAAPELSVAVLPFNDMSPGGNQAYFADGMSGELLNLLSRVPGLTVAARTSSFSFREKSADTPTIAEKLGVAHLLEGSVLKNGDQIQLTAQLIDTRTGAYRWSATFDRELTDVFALQDEIAQAVTRALDMQLPDGEMPVAQRYDAVAYDLYLQAGPLWAIAAAAAKRRALGLLSRAVELDPDFGPAWVRLAYAHMGLAGTEHAGSHRTAHGMLLRGALLGEASAVVGLGWVAVAARKDMRDGFEYFRVGNELAAPNDWIVSGSTALMCQYLGAPEQSAAPLSNLLGMAREKDLTLAAAVHAQRGDTDTAFDLLESAANDPGIISIRRDAPTRFKNLVGHPRWDALLMRHGLHDSQRPPGLCGFP